MSEKIFTRIFTLRLHVSECAVLGHWERAPIDTKFSLVVVRRLGFQVRVKVERILESLRGYMRRICSIKLRKSGLV